MQRDVGLRELLLCRQACPESHLHQVTFKGPFQLQQSFQLYLLEIHGNFEEFQVTDTYIFF